MKFSGNMARKTAAISNSIIRKQIDLCLDSERITRQEYLQLTSVILSNKNISEEDLHQINRVFDRVQMGRIKLIDDRP
jgi:Ca2+-binding EF-hand superfamily protein